jgi:hypothetical protein
MKQHLLLRLLFLRSVLTACWVRSFCVTLMWLLVLLVLAAASEGATAPTGVRYMLSGCWVWAVLRFETGVVVADWCEAVLHVLLLLYDLQQQQAVGALTVLGSL